MTLLEKIKVNINYLLGKAEPKLYAKDYKSPKLSLKDWQKRWEIFSTNDSGFIWYAADSEDNLAEFTGEDAYIPEIFFQNFEDNKKAFDFFANLPKITASILPKNLRTELRQLATNFNNEKSVWKTGASQGLYIFDETNNFELKVIFRGFYLQLP